MNTLELIQRLEQLICPSWSPKHSKPVWGCSKVCITNGHIAILINHDEPLEDWNHDETLIRQVEPMIKLDKRTPFLMPSIEPNQTWLTPNKPVKTECSECWGTGVVECNYGHDHECDECDGKGVLEHPLITKWFDTVFSDRHYQTDIGLFDKRYLWIVSEIAKHRTVTYSARKAGDGTILCFEFEDGFGGLISVADRSRAA